jgi:hypothetical protein
MITNPAPKGCATNVVSLIILSLNALCLVIVTGITTRRGERRRRRSTTRRRAAIEREIVSIFHIIDFGV